MKTSIISILICLFSVITFGQTSEDVADAEVKSEISSDTEVKKKEYVLGGKKKKAKDLFFITQNSPNPFNSFTAINYHLTMKAEASIVFYNKDNQVYRTVKLSGKDLHGSVLLSRGMFETGKYQYAFVVNGEVIDFKTMVVTD